MLETKKLRGTERLPKIPIAWIQKVLTLKRKRAPLKLALYILYQTKYTDPGDVIQISSQEAEDMFGVSQSSFSRALDILEALNMIRVRRHSNRSPEVEIILEEEI